MENGYVSKDGNLDFIGDYRLKYNTGNIPIEIRNYFNVITIDKLGLHYKLTLKDEIKMNDVIHARDILEKYDWPSAMRLGKTNDKKRIY